MEKTRPTLNVLDSPLFPPTFWLSLISNQHFCLAFVSLPNRVTTNRKEESQLLYRDVPVPKFPKDIVRVMNFFSYKNKPTQRNILLIDWSRSLNLSSSFCL